MRRLRRFVGEVELATVYHRTILSKSWAVYSCDSGLAKNSNRKVHSIKLLGVSSNLAG